MRPHVSDVSIALIARRTSFSFAISAFAYSMVSKNKECHQSMLCRGQRQKRVVVGGNGVGVAARYLQARVYKHRSA